MVQLSVFALPFWIITQWNEWLNEFISFAGRPRCAEQEEVFTGDKRLNPGGNRSGIFLGLLGKREKELTRELIGHSHDLAEQIVCISFIRHLHVKGPEGRAHQGFLPALGPQSSSQTPSCWLPLEQGTSLWSWRRTEEEMPPSLVALLRGPGKG